MRASLFRLVVALVWLVGCAGLGAGAGDPRPMSHKADFTYQPVTGIGREEGVCRRDPGDVIKVGDAWYVWYTKVVKQDTEPGRHGYPSGYQGSVFFAVSRDAGRTWSEKGEAAPKGTPGAFDCTATFTPNILVWKDRYWLYYTAVGPGFDNGPYADCNRTSIGLCVADKPDGPWKKVSDKPVFTTSRDPQKFDSYRVDDTCFLVRRGEIWMYYKGRQWQRTPGETKMGVAVADRPEGPFRRLNQGEPVQDSGHEVLVWPLGKGVMSLVSNTGPNRMTLQCAEDGVTFEVVGRLPKNYPRAPGVFRADLTDPQASGKGVTWGISMAAYRGDPYLQRYEITLEQIRPPSPRMYFADTASGKPFSKDPAVVRFKGRYRLYYSLPPYEGKATKGWSIGIATSRNLVDWQKAGELTPTGEAERNGFCAPGAIVLGDRVHLFYQTYGNRAGDAICHAWSEDGVHFTRDPTNPVFRPTGDWNCGRAIDADVIPFKGRLLLYWATRDPKFRIQMQGVSAAPLESDFSRDTWTQLNRDGPILKAELPWEGGCIEAAAMALHDGRLYMFYAGNYNNRPQQIGVAVSDDGVHFRRLFKEPFLPCGKPGQWNASESGHPFLFQDEGQDYLFYQGNTDDGKTWHLSVMPIDWNDGLPVLAPEKLPPR